MDLFCKEDRKALFDGKEVSSLLPYESLEANAPLIQSGLGRLSISGAQEKYSMIEKNGKLILCPEGEHGHYILKPKPADRRFLFREDMPANEYLTMHIAHAVYHIPVAASGLCRFANGETAYICRRFDYKPDGSKYAVEDFASIAGLNRERYGEDYKYSILSYEDCAQIIADNCISAKAELLKFFRQILFNYLFLNADAHLKNFTLMEYLPGDYRLSPAYDLLNTQMHLSTSIFALEKGLFKEGMPRADTAPAGRPLFVEFGRRIGIPARLVEKEITYFAGNYASVWQMIDGSPLSGEARKSYIYDYKYRLSTLR